MIFDFNETYSFILFPDLVFPLVPAAPAAVEETVVIGGGATSVSISLTGSLDQVED